MASPKRNEQECEIAQLLGAVFYAICGTCYHHLKLAAEDADEAACGYYERGWRVKAEKLICGKCRKA